MSDEDRDIDIETDDDEDDLGQSSDNTSGYTQAEKRAHHNALERKRRDHIKDSFTSLRDSVPLLQGEKVSRAQILKKASEYIVTMRKKNTNHQKDIEDLTKQNENLEAKIKILERSLNAGKLSKQASSLMNARDNRYNRELSESESSEAEEKLGGKRRKKLKS